MPIEVIQIEQEPQQVDVTTIWDIFNEPPLGRLEYYLQSNK